MFHSGIFLTAPLLLVGLALGCWFAWRWIAERMNAILALTALALGILVGLWHFHALRRGTEALMLEDSAGRAALLVLARFAVTIGFLVAAALAGAWPLVGGAAGIGIGRALVLRRAKAAMR